MFTRTQPAGQRKSCTEVDEALPDCAALAALHADGLTDKVIARRLGLGPNGDDAPFGDYERSWLALQLMLGVDPEHLVDQAREVILGLPRQLAEREDDAD